MSDLIKAIGSNAPIQCAKSTVLKNRNSRRIWKLWEPTRMSRDYTDFASSSLISEIITNTFELIYRQTGSEIAFISNSLFFGWKPERKPSIKLAPHAWILSGSCLFTLTIDCWFGATINNTMLTCSLTLGCEIGFTSAKSTEFDNFLTFKRHLHRWKKYFSLRMKYYTELRNQPFVMKICFNLKVSVLWIV